MGKKEKKYESCMNALVYDHTPVTSLSPRLATLMCQKWAKGEKITPEDVEQAIKSKVKRK